MIYTIQNEKGDEGFIQKIDGEKVIDEVMGGTFILNNVDYYFVISKEEYEAIKSYHDLINEHGLEEDMESCQQYIQIVLKRNKNNLLGYCE